MRFNKTKEISSKELEKKFDPEDSSARHRYKKNSNISLKLLDKIVKPMNKCPNCKGSNTYHHRMQKNNIEDNVWRRETRGDGKISITAKFDLCLDCSKEFLMEMFIWKRLN